MQGKTVVITGGTSGIGEVAALALACLGARIVLIARDPSRIAATMTKLGAVHTFHQADLSSVADTARVASEIAAAEPRIDVLINNAGALFSHREETAEGLERTFALNHMSYFVLTAGLLERLKAAPGARIVSTSSDAHRAAKLDFDDLQSKNNYRGFTVYGTSKLCNILFTRELARRLEGTGATAMCLHPGFVATRFADNNADRLGKTFRVLKSLFALTPEQGARTIIHLASAPELAAPNGSYWHKCKPVTPRATARDDAAALRLWNMSEEIARG